MLIGRPIGVTAAKPLPARWPTRFEVSHTELVDRRRFQSKGWGFACSEHRFHLRQKDVLSRLSTTKVVHL